MILPKSFENLSNISKQPSLSRWVTKINYEATTLELLEHDEWRERLPVSPEAPPIPEHPGYPFTPRARRHYVREIKAWDLQYGPGSQFSDAELRDAWAAYRDVMNATDEIEIYYEDFATLNSVFRSLPNLKSLEFNTNQDPSDIMKAAFASTLISPAPAYDMDRELASALSLRYLTPLFLALIYTGVKLTSFKADAISWHAFQCPIDGSFFAKPRGPTVDFPWQIEPKDLTLAFRNLRQLHLVFEPEVAPDISLLGEQEVLCRVLKSANLLEDLRLEFHEPFYSSIFPPEQVFLHNVCGDIVWPHLEKLELSGVRVSEDYLVIMLKRQSQTLKTLKLHSMYLCRGQWASAFQRMRADLRLTDVAFHDVFINTDDSEDDEDLDDEEEDDIYLDMYAPLGEIFESTEDLGDRLKTYFLGDGYRCPLKTKEQKAWMRAEQEKAQISRMRGDPSARATWQDGLKNC